MASSKGLVAYRLVARKWASSAFSGEGARLYGGRWNTPGHPVVYLGSSRSLCALEMLVHLPTPKSRQKQFSFLSIDLAKTSMERLTPPFPENWQAEPATVATQQLGDEWISEGTSLVLEVPSAVVPEEVNYLLNPLHPEFGKLTISEPERFQFDARL